MDDGHGRSVSNRRVCLRRCPRAEAMYANGGRPQTSTAWIGYDPVPDASGSPRARRVTASRIPSDTTGAARHLAHPGSSPHQHARCAACHSGVIHGCRGNRWRLQLASIAGRSDSKGGCRYNDPSAEASTVCREIARARADTCGGQTRPSGASGVGKSRPPCGPLAVPYQRWRANRSLRLTVWSTSSSLEHACVEVDVRLCISDDAGDVMDAVDVDERALRDRRIHGHRQSRPRGFDGGVRGLVGRSAFGSGSLYPVGATSFGASG